MNEDFDRDLPKATLSKKYKHRLEDQPRGPRDAVYNVYSFCTQEGKDFTYDNEGYFTNVTRRVTEATDLSTAINEDFHRDLPIAMLKQKYKHRLDDQVRDAAYNVYCFCTKEGKEFAHVNEGYFTNVTRRVTEATGLSTSYVTNLVNEYRDVGPEAFLKPILRNQKNAFYKLKKKKKTFETNTEETLNPQCENCEIIIPDLDQNVSEDKNKDDVITRNEPFQINSYTHDYDKNIHQETLKNMTDLESTSELRKNEDFDTDLPIIKLNKKYPYRLNYHVRVLVYNVCCYFMKEVTEFAQVKRGYFTNIYKRVATATGVSSTFTYNIMDEYKSIGPEAFLTPISRNRHRASKRLKKKAEISIRLKKEEEASTRLKTEQEALTRLKKKVDASKRLKKKADASKRLKKKANASKRSKKKAKASTTLKKKAEASKRLRKKVEASTSKMQQTNNPTFLNFEMKTGETLNMQYEKFDDIKNYVNDKNVLEVKIKTEIDIIENEPFQDCSYFYYVNTNMCQTPENTTELNSTSIKIKTEDDTSLNFESSPAIYDSQSVKLEPTTADLHSNIVAPDISIKKEVSNPFVCQPSTSTGIYDGPEDQ